MVQSLAEQLRQSKNEEKQLNTIKTNNIKVEAARETHFVSSDGANSHNTA